MSDRAPAYRDPLLHFDALGLVALRERDRNEEALATENEKEMLMRRACARTLSSRTFLLLGNCFPEACQERRSQCGNDMEV